MRFKFEGRWEAETLSKIIEKELIDFFQQFDVRHLSGINLYFNPYSEDGTPLEIESSEGKVMAGITYKNPTQPKRVRKKKHEAQIIPFRLKRNEQDDR